MGKEPTSAQIPSIPFVVAVVPLGPGGTVTRLIESGLGAKANVQRLREQHHTARRRLTERSLIPAGIYAFEPWAKTV